MSSKPVTRPSLLLRVRNAADAESWRQFENAYGDLILRYCTRRGLQFADAEDVRQVVLAKLARALRHFQYDPSKGRFRDYVGQCVRNAIASEFRRHKAATPTVSLHGGGFEPVAREDGEEVWQEEWVRHHYRRAMRSLRSTCGGQSLAVFDSILAGRSYAEIARSLNGTEAAVRKIKQRMRDRLQQIIARQVEDEEIAES